MPLNSTDLPSIISLPEDIKSILKLVEERLELGIDVMILDMRQHTLISHSGELQGDEVTAESLPFLLSNHSVEVLPSKDTIEKCVLSLEEQEGVICIFHHPEESLESSLPLHPTKIVNSGALLGLLHQESRKYFASITLG